MGQGHRCSLHAVGFSYQAYSSARSVASKARCMNDSAIKKITHFFEKE